MEKEIAVLIVATELRLNRSYYEKWQQQYAKAMLNVLKMNNVVITDEIEKQAQTAGMLFLENVLTARKDTQNGWIYDFT
jgi:hypothetical protein